MDVIGNLSYPGLVLDPLVGSPGIDNPDLVAQLGGSVVEVVVVNYIVEVLSLEFSMCVHPNDFGESS